MKNLMGFLKQNIRYIALILFGIILVLGFFFYESRKDRILIDNSQVSAPVISISPVTPGKLKEIDVYEGEKVKKGDLLAVTDTETLRADSDGIIALANNQIGAITNSQNPVIQMIRPIDMRIAGTIDENKGLNDIKVGQPVSFTIDAFPGEKFWGYIDEISPIAKQTQAAFSISSERPTQQFIVYAKFNTEKFPQIKNGMSAKMTVYTK